MLEFDQHVFQTAQLLRETQIISVQKQYPAREKIPKIKNYTAVMLLVKRAWATLIIICVIHNSHCFSFSTWMWWIRVKLQPEKEWNKGKEGYPTEILLPMWAPPGSTLTWVLPSHSALCAAEWAVQVCKDQIQLLWELLTAWAGRRHVFNLQGYFQCISAPKGFRSLGLYTLI